MTGTSAYDDFPDLFDRFTAVWDRMSAEFSDWVAAALPGRAGAGVDLGFGADRHSVLLAERLDRVLAVDNSAWMLEVARSTRDRPGRDAVHPGPARPDAVDRDRRGGCPPRFRQDADVSTPGGRDY